MKQVPRTIWQDETGQDIAEYAILLAVIALVVIAAVSAIGTNASSLFNAIAGRLTTGGGSPAPPK
jgi:pilus assembly protein Flp/PilA